MGVEKIIIVMEVMKGFREEIMKRIMGINGKIIMKKIESKMDDYEEIIKSVDEIKGIKFDIKVVEGKEIVKGNIGEGKGEIVRGLSEEEIEKMKII